jgi:hypothetical protein
VTDDEKISHPSYGTVQFNRVTHSGRQRLFGSALRTHYNTIRLVIRRAQLSHDYGHDRVFGHRELVEVELSAAQFSELLTTMNCGTGVPCTIRFHSTEGGPGVVPDPPELDTEVDRSRATFRRRMVDVLHTVKPHLQRMVQLSEKLPTKKAREEFREEVQQIAQEFESNVPFFLEQFREATERVTVAAKSEIEAFVSHVVIAAGLQAVAEGRVDASLLAEAAEPRDLAALPEGES